jgi:3-phenylpropionate/cinnamic acid dioxygenase small subunit
MAYDLQTISDYLEIRDLCGRYNRYADIGDGEMYASVYTEDGEFRTVGDRVCRGREEIAAQGASRTTCVHITADPMIEVNGDTARQTSRLLAFYRANDASENYFVATGWYTDELVRTPEGWRIAVRTVKLDLDTDEAMKRLQVTPAS